MSVSWVLFDLDGTLTDSKLGIVRCIRHALERMGLDLPDDETLGQYIGPPLQSVFPKLIGSDDIAHVDVAIKHYRERFGEVGLFDNEVYDGIPAALQALEAHGLNMVLATSKPLPYAERIINHFELGHFFRGLYGSTMDGVLSAKADIIALALKREAIPPEEAIMVGDRKHDILGAKFNGIASIGVLYGYGDRDELTLAGASLLCEKPSDLPGLIV